MICRQLFLTHALSSLFHTFSQFPSTARHTTWRHSYWRQPHTRSPFTQRMSPPITSLHCPVGGLLTTMLKQALQLPPTRTYASKLVVRMHCIRRELQTDFTCVRKAPPHFTSRFGVVCYHVVPVHK
ncbi:hypothetical protein EDB80DRAFT_697704 [Ilyonectria destructans]|nr:hypothetical protein EDB80DRAFT_697704 [Ilyonectria destructans]